MKLDLGLVGLGRMGSAVLSRLLDEGHRATVYNRSPAAATAFLGRGVSVADSPGDVAREGGLVLSLLADENAVREACLGERGIVPRLRGGTHLAMSTVSPEFAQEMALAHEAAGVSYISAPVQGRPAMAQHGQLVAWISGPPVPEPARVALTALCQRQVLLGPDVRHACAAKLALNFLMFANVELFAEAFAYIESMGADRAVFAQGLVQSVFPGPLFGSIAAALQTEDTRAKGSDMNLCVKDLQLMLSGVAAPDALPVARRLEAVYRAAVEQGLGPRDASAIRERVYPK
jgi:3-hydroxyisobutyrate dehydrogenase-like beta-hydroxyacid dehydrogenase